MGFQDEVLAWMAGWMLAEQRLPRMLLPGAVIRVGAQTGLEVDDVAAQSESGGMVVCQAKAGLSLGRELDSPFAKALGQVLSQYLAGVPDGAGRRPPRRGTDVLAIVTDMTAPETVRRHLAEAVARTGGQPPGTPLGWQLTQEQQTALTVALDHLRRLWAERGEHPSDEDLRELFGVLYVSALDISDGGADRAAVLVTLRGLVPAGQDSAVWRSLVGVAHDASERRHWYDRRALVGELARDGVAVGPGPFMATDIEWLRSVTDDNLAMLRPHAVVPVADGLHLRRDIDAALSNASPADGSVLLVGNAGSGKTGLVVTLAATRLAAGQDVVVLRAADFAAGPVTGGMNLSHPLSQVLLDWTGAGPATLVIDALDAARGDESQVARLAGLVTALSGSRWQVLATVRTYDVLFGPTLQAAFAGPALGTDLDLEWVDERLPNVRHIRVGDFTDAELSPVLSGSKPIADLFTRSTPELRALLRNPFNLWLATELVESNTPLCGALQQRVSGARTRLHLLAAYWKRRVQEPSDAFERTDVLTLLAREMLEHRRLRTLVPSLTVPGAHGPAINGLLSDNVLAVEPQPGTAVAQQVITFSHHVLFDYAVMQCVLRNPLEPLQLIARLDADPALPLIARPSLDLLWDELWELGADHSEYWKLVLAVATSPHLLASLAAAAHLVAAGPSAEDLKPLLAACRSENGAQHTAGYTLIRQVVGVVGAKVTSDSQVAAIAPGVACFAATLIRDAIDQSAGWDRLAITVDLVRALEGRRPLTADLPDAHHRATAIVHLVDACRSDPVSFERIAIAAARQLGAAIKIDERHAGAVARLLDDAAALEQWGGRILTELVEALPPLASLDPDLAFRLASTVWTFEETRDENVEFISSPLLPMVESRQQQAETARWRLGQVFVDLCRVDPVTSARVFADITNRNLYPSPDPARDRERWPLTVGQTRGWLSYGCELQFQGGYDAMTTMAAAVGVALAEAAASDRDPGPILGVLVEALRSAPGWAAILTADVDRAALASAVAPALETGSLLAHPDTHQAAGQLLAVLASRADAAQHAQLEAAVVAARDRAVAAGLRDEVIDALLGCLNPEHLTGGVAAARFEELNSGDGPPSLMPPPRWEAHWEGRETLLDDLRMSGETIDASLAESVAALDEDMATIQNRSESDQAEVPWRLPERFLAADHAGAWSPTAPLSIRRRLVEAATTLATHDDPTPTSTVGRRVAVILLQAARADDAGKPTEGSLGWSPGLRDEAGKGVVLLLARAVWRDSEMGPRLRTTLRALLTDASSVVRMQATHGIRLAADNPPDPPAVVSLVRDHLLNENEPLVLTVLLRSLQSVTIQVPQAVDELLREFSEQPQGAFLANDPEGTTSNREGSDDDERWSGHDATARLGASMLVYLAVKARTPFASERLAAWLDAPLAELERTRILLHQMRPFLNPADGQGQQVAFEFLARATEVAVSTWGTATAPGAASITHTETSNADPATAAKVALHIGQELFYASGAFDNRTNANQQAVSRGDLATFANHALPILRVVGAIQHAQVTQPVVDTLIHLHPVNPRRVLLTTAEVVPEQGGYVTDSLAAGKVISYLSRLLAEHRDLVLGDHDGITAFRRLLQAFAAAGHADALAMAYTFSDVFR